VRPEPLEQGSNLRYLGVVLVRARFEPPPLLLLLPRPPASFCFQFVELPIEVTIERLAGAVSVDRQLLLPQFATTPFDVRVMRY